MKKVCNFLKLAINSTLSLCEGYNYFRNKWFSFKSENLELGDKTKEYTKAKQDRKKFAESESNLMGWYTEATP